MPIPFGCDCGKKLQAKDEFAGRKMKCPDCGKLLAIPARAEAPPSLEAVIAPAAPEEETALDPGGLAFTALPEPEPEPELVPEPERDTDEPPPQTAPKPRPYVDPLVAQTITPWADANARRRGADGQEPRHEKVGSWFGTFVLLLLFVGAGAALWYFAPQFAASAREYEEKLAKPAPGPVRALTDLDRVPGDALAFVTLKPADAAALKLNPRVLPPFDARSRATLTDLRKVADVERLTVVLLRPQVRLDVPEEPSGGLDHWVLVRTATPYVKSAVLKRFFPEGKLKTYRGKTYVREPREPPDLKPGPGNRPPPAPEVPPPPPRAPVVYFVNPHLFVLADTYSIRRFLGGPSLATTAGPLRSALKSADDDHVLTVGLNQTASLLAPQGKGLQLQPSPFTSFTTAAVTVDAAGDIAAELRLEFGNAQQAGAVVKSVKSQQTLASAARAKIRRDVTAKRFQRLGTLLRTLASATAALTSPHGPLTFTPDLPDVRGAADEEKLLQLVARLDDYQEAVKVARNGKLVTVTVTAGPDRAELAATVWMPYLQMALNARPQPRHTIDPEKMKRP